MEQHRCETGKLYNKYLEKKKLDAVKIYIYKYGNLYIFLGEDAETISQELRLKLSSFST